MKRTDIVSGIFLAAISLLLLFWIIPLNTSPPQSEGNLSPAFMPSVAAIVMLCLSALLAVVTWLGNDARADEPHEEFGDEARGLGAAELADIAIWSVFATAMMAGFLTLGFLPTSIAALVLAMLYTGQRQPVTIVVVAAATPFIIQQIAWYAFSVQLP